MITRNALGAAALATTCLTPLAAFADDFNLGPATPATGAAAPAASGSTVGGMPFWGYIDLGVEGVIGNNPNEAGRYTGLNTNGVDGYGDFNLTARAPWNSDSSRYYNFTGDNLVFQTGSHLGMGLGSDSGWAANTANSIINSGDLFFKAGDQGVWGVDGWYRAVTYTGNVIDSIYTVNEGNAFLNAPLANWGGASCLPGPMNSTNCKPGYTSGYLTSGAGVALLEAADQPVQMGTRRDIFGTDFKYQTGPWTFSGNIRHEHKEGSVEDSLDGFTDLAFALPVDSDTDRYDANVAYNTKNFQGAFSYTLSHFVDNINFVNIPYPTSNTKLPYQINSAYGTPPSNDAHYLTLMLADNNLIPQTRLNLNARYGWELQNDNFVPNNANPGTFGESIPGYNNGGVNGSGQGTSASSPDIIASVFQAKASATSHPYANTDARVYYGIDTRDVSLNQFGVVGSGNSATDTGPGYATTATAPTYYAYVVPQTWVKQNAGIDLGYMVLPETSTKVTVGYRFDDTDRSNAQVSHSHTDSASVNVLSNITKDVSGKLSFDYSDRSGVLNYLEPWSNLDGKVAGDFSGAYFQAPMTSEGVTARLDYNPWQKLAGEIFVQFKNENYNYPSDTSGDCTGFPAVAGASAGTPAGCEPYSTTTTATTGVTTTTYNIPVTNQGQGVKQDFALVVGPDITYKPTKDINLHFFYTYEEIFWKTTGNGECSTLGNVNSAGTGTAQYGNNALCAGAAGYYYNTYDSGTHTVGLSGEWRVNPKLKLKGEYTVSYGSVMFTEFNGVWVPTPTTAYQNVANYPDIDSFMNNLSVTATYELVPNIDLVVRGALMTFRNNDWDFTAAPVQLTATNTVSLLTPGDPTPTYAVGILSAGVRFKF